tara:strand:- start:381 stop:659 length:279 start_codon:yes stop_codon:yes gene_type:complete
MKSTNHKNGDVSIRFNLTEQQALEVMLTRLVRIYKKRRDVEVLRVRGHALHGGVASQMITLYNEHLQILDDLVARTDPLVRNGSVSRYDYTT